jgi:hypothetical protein
MNQAELVILVTELNKRIEALESKVTELSKPRDRGPASTGEMTEEHAFRVKFGDLKDTKHKAAAELLGLSYGQIFSCRGGYTFKQVTKDWKKPEVKTEETTK